MEKIKEGKRKERYGEVNREESDIQQTTNNKQALPRVYFCSQSTIKYKTNKTRDSRMQEVG